MQSRDPEDRAPTVTVGVGRAILSNRISHFLNIKGPRYVETEAGISKYSNITKYDCGHCLLGQLGVCRPCVSLSDNW